MSIAPSTTLPVAQPVTTSIATKKSVEKRCARALKVRANVRKTFPPEAELRALGRSVIKRQIHPLIVLGDIILDGECRWRGVMLEKPDHELDVIAVDREMTGVEVCELQLVSAMHSATLTSYDQALACKEWMAANPQAAAKDLAEKIDRDPSMVGILLSLWRCIPAVHKAAEEGKIGPKAWKPISLLPEDQQPELLQMHLTGMAATQIAKISRQRRNGSGEEESVKVTRLVSKVPGRSATITIAGQDLSLTDAIEIVQEWLKLAKKSAEEGLSAKTFAKAMSDKADGK